jgi:hypothetical protein
LWVVQVKSQRCSRSPQHTKQQRITAHLLRTLDRFQGNHRLREGTINIFLGANTVRWFRSMNGTEAGCTDPMAIKATQAISGGTRDGFRRTIKDAD